MQIFQIDAMPLTAVGKVFKPQLRWDAATRALTEMLVPLAEKGIDYGVHVGPHGSHGSIAKVTIADVPACNRDVVAEDVHAVLAPLVLRHELVFE